MCQEKILQHTVLFNWPKISCIDIKFKRVEINFKAFLIEILVMLTLGAQYCKLKFFYGDHVRYQGDASQCMCHEEILQHPNVIHLEINPVFHSRIKKI